MLDSDAVALWPQCQRADAVAFAPEKDGVFSLAVTIDENVSAVDLGAALQIVHCAGGNQQIGVAVKQFGGAGDGFQRSIGRSAGIGVGACGGDVYLLARVGEDDDRGGGGLDCAGLVGGRESDGVFAGLVVDVGGVEAGEMVKFAVGVAEVPIVMGGKRSAGGGEDGQAVDVERAGGGAGGEEDADRGLGGLSESRGRETEENQQQRNGAFHGFIPRLIEVVRRAWERGRCGARSSVCVARRGRGAGRFESPVRKVR